MFLLKWLARVSLGAFLVTGAIPQLRAENAGSSPAPRPAAADPAVYGSYPQNYQEIITKWLETQLLDAASAKIEWLGAPTPAELPAVDGKALRGYRVDFKINSRNRFGSYTGMQKHGALIRDGEVIKGIGFGY